jgi:hypothetical protein
MSACADLVAMAAVLVAMLVVGNDVTDQIHLGCCHGGGGLVEVEIGGRVMLGLDMVAQAVEEVRRHIRFNLTDDLHLFFRN